LILIAIFHPFQTTIIYIRVSTSQQAENGLSLENQLKKEIIRITMKKIEYDFLENKKIIRCHKSYFVNLSKVKTTSGNARALYLHINELDFQIPVSRNFSKEIVLGTN